ncbi:MAG: hypothetical protein U1A78_31770 [Polyangia bacterium]
MRGALLVVTLALAARCGLPNPDWHPATGAVDAGSGPGALDAAADAPPPEPDADDGSSEPPDGGSEPDAATAPAIRTGITRCGVPDSCEFMDPRDPASWPFDPCSPWNRPIGDGAVYADVSSPALSTRAGGAQTTAAINCTEWSHPVFREDPAAGRATALSGSDEQGHAVSYWLMLPQVLTPAVGTDGHLHVIDAAERTVYEMFEARWSADGSSVLATDLIKNDLYGAGVFDGAASPQGEIWHGVRAYGGSAIAGLIRKGELQGGIRHALAIAVQRAAMNQNTPNGRGYVWPASYRDDGWERTYGSSGNVHMGTLLALTASEPRPQIFSREGITDPGVQAIAAALQDYGAYVVDATSDNLTFYAEPAELAAERIDTAQLARLLPYLRVISNSDAEHVGGGGHGRQCFAPPL